MLQDLAPMLPAWLARRTITVADYYRMAEAGILTAQDRVELIEGQIIQMVPIGSAHSGDVNRLAYLLITQLGRRAVVTVQNPVRLSTISEPEPDLAVLKPRADFYRSGHPGPGEVLLLIEVADASLPYDRDVKAAVYACHGIPEFWILDVRDRSVTVHRDPVSGVYASLTTVAAGPLAIAALPDVVFDAAELLG